VLYLTNQLIAQPTLRRMLEYRVREKVEKRVEKKISAGYFEFLSKYLPGGKQKHCENSHQDRWCIHLDLNTRYSE
jgi:hypothetical protein